MELPLALSAVLVASALWNLLIWPRFLQRIRKDPRARDGAGRPTAFLRVHVVLIGVSLLLAVLVGVIGVVTLSLGIEAAT